MTTDLVKLAEDIATAAHAGQFRRDGITPYILHPGDVAERIESDPEAQAVAWLHDTLEDTEETADTLRDKGIPERVISAVDALTKRYSKGVKNKEKEYFEYLKKVAADPLAAKVKIADMLSNLADTPTEEQIAKYEKGLQVLREGKVQS